MHRVLFGKREYERAYACERGEYDRRGNSAVAEHAQGNELTGDRRADVRAEYDSCGLRESHYSGVYETYHHDARRARALYCGGCDRADAHAQKLALGRFCE